MKVGNQTFTIGADPEVFVGLDGKFVSAHDMVPGDKQNPHPVKHGAVQVDGMALEFNTDPAEDYEEFQRNLDAVKEQLVLLLPDNELKFLEGCSVTFDEKFLESVPALNKVLGCNPDFNAWFMDVNDEPDSDAMMRTAGGHVHVGGFPTDSPYRTDHFEKSAALARLMDEEVGVYSILWDQDDKRRSMYGKAGCFRPKPYGMEYRSLSNAWIFSRGITRFVFEGTQRAIQRLCDGATDVDERVRGIIDNSDRNSDFFNNNKLADMIKEM